MPRARTSLSRVRRKLVPAGAVFAISFLAGCANGDFGRVRPSLVHDHIHDWIGTDTVGPPDKAGFRPGLTDDERQLRDLAYPLIEPPYNRNRWYSMLGEYGAGGFRPGQVDQTAYSSVLMLRSYRSTTARYAQLIEDVRNDIVRVAPFFRSAARVVDLDRKRQQSLAYVTDLPGEDQTNVVKRASENLLIVDWVDQSLNGRVAAYRYALGRLVVTYPSAMAVEAERAINQLQIKIGENRFVVADATMANSSAFRHAAWADRRR